MWGILLFVFATVGQAEAVGPIQVEGENRLIRARAIRLLNELSRTESGATLIHQLESRSHIIQIFHDEASSTIEQSGNTVAVISRDMRNGIGVSSIIRLNFRAPDHGSHCVPGQDGTWIEFPLIINLHHELTHAWHFSSGTYRPGYSEYLAIESENLLRAELGLPQRNPNFHAGIRRPVEGCHGQIPDEFLRN